MALDLALAVDLLTIAGNEHIFEYPERYHLRSSKVILLGIHKEARLHSANRHLDRKRLVLPNYLEVLREHKFGRGHIVRRRYDPYRRGVARARLDLLAVRDREILQSGEAEVDEVVGGGQRADLASGGYVLAVVGEGFADDSGVKG